MNSKMVDNIFGRRMVTENSDGWFVGEMYDALFHVDFKRNEYQLLKILPCNDVFFNRLYLGCDKIERFLYIYPRRLAGNILVVSLEGNIIKEITLENPNNKDVEIVDTCIYSGKIYMMSLGLKKILVLDVKGNKIVNSYNIFHDVEIKSYHGQMLYCDNSIYISIQDSNRIYKLDLKKGKMKQYELDDVMNGVYSFGDAGRELWFTSKEKVIFLWDKINYRLRKIEELPEKFGRYRFNSKRQLVLDLSKEKDEEGICFNGVYKNNILWLIPEHYNMILCINMVTLEIEEILIPREDENEYSWTKRLVKAKFCVEYIRQDRYIGVYSYKNNHIFEVDMLSKQIDIREFSISNVDAELLMLQRYRKKGFLLETENIKLKDYIIKLRMQSKKNKKKDNVGYYIYSSVIV